MTTRSLRIEKILPPSVAHAIAILVDYCEQCEDIVIHDRSINVETWLVQQFLNEALSSLTEGFGTLGDIDPNAGPMPQPSKSVVVKRQLVKLCEWIEWDEGKTFFQENGEDWLDIWLAETPQEEQTPEWESDMARVAVMLEQYQARVTG
ncbi:MAG: hypothetical protein ACFBSC_17635 [Microcoleaceae cyanobacterium]